MEERIHGGDYNSHNILHNILSWNYKKGTIVEIFWETYKFLEYLTNSEENKIDLEFKTTDNKYIHFYNDEEFISLEDNVKVIKISS